VGHDGVSSLVTVFAGSIAPAPAGDNRSTVAVAGQGAAQIRHGETGSMLHYQPGDAQDAPPVALPANHLEPFRPIGEFAQKEDGAAFARYLTSGVIHATRQAPIWGQPKLGPAAQSLLDRGFVSLDPHSRLPRLFFTETGLAALRTMMRDRRLADPERFAHIRTELGIDPPMARPCRTGLGVLKPPALEGFQRPTRPRPVRPHVPRGLAQIMP
jgi:hypothetical protein